MGKRVIGRDPRRFVLVAAAAPFFVASAARAQPAEQPREWKIQVGYER